jgi:hypothetical protein
LHAKPNFCYVETYDETPEITSIDATNLTKKQLQMYFGIKVIKWTVSKPIDNEFK